MKKLAALSLALLFALGMTAAAAETYTAQGFYTIEYPEGLTLDNTSYTDESNDDNVWLYLLTNDDYMIDAYITKLDEYTGFSLYSATESERENYVTDTLDDYADYAASLVETVTTAEGIPFYVYSMLSPSFTMRRLKSRSCSSSRASPFLSRKRLLPTG